MSLVDLTFGYSSARVWFDELPSDAKLSCVASLVSELYVADRSVTSQRRKLAVEIFLNRDPRFNYTLLGGEFEPAGHDYRIQACVQEELHAVPGDAPRLGVRFGAPSLVGMPGSAAADIIRTPLEAIGPLPAGMLTVTHALYNRTDVSAYVLWCATGFITRLLLQPADLPADELLSLLRLELSEQMERLKRQYRDRP
jgi:hypothetical protein